MKIGFFTDSYVPQANGVATSVSSLTQELEVLGQSIYTFAPKMGDFVDRQMNVYRILSVRYMKNPPYYLATPVSVKSLRKIRRLRLDVIHVHTPLSMGAIAYQAAKMYRLPLVYTYHTLMSEYVHYVRIGGKMVIPTKTAIRLANAASAFTCNLCDHIIAPSEKVKELLLRYGVKRPITVIHNGVQIERFRVGRKGYLRHRLGLTEEQRILLFVGRLGLEKNPEFILRAFVYILDLLPSVHLILVGDGYARASLELLARELGIAQRVTFAGSIPYQDMPLVYADASLFVSASTSEVHPMAILEALASGLPVVAVWDKALDSAVVDGVNGYFVEPDERQFAEKVAMVLQDSARWQEMSQNSLHISQRFSIRAQARRLTEVYEQVCNQAR